MNGESRRSLMTIPEVAGLLNIHRRRAAALLQRGTLPGRVAIGRAVRVRPEAIESFLNRGGCAGPVSL